MLHQIKHTLLLLASIFIVGCNFDSGTLIKLKGVDFSLDIVKKIGGETTINIYEDGENMGCLKMGYQDQIDVIWKPNSYDEIAILLLYKDNVDYTVNSKRVRLFNESNGVLFFDTYFNPSNKPNKKVELKPHLFCEMRHPLFFLYKI